MSLAPLEFRDIHQGRLFQTPLGDEDSWTISAPFEDGFRHEIKLSLGVPKGQKWGEWISANRPENFDPGNDAHRWYHAHSSSQEIGSAFSIESSTDLIDRLRLGADRNHRAILRRAGFKRKYRFSYEEGRRIVHVYEVAIANKGTLQFTFDEGGARVSYDGKNSRWTSNLASVVTAVYHEYGDKQYHPTFWPEGCKDPMAVLAQFTVDVIIPFVTETRMDRRRG